MLHVVMKRERLSRHVQPTLWQILSLHSEARNYSAGIPATFGLAGVRTRPKIVSVTAFYHYLSMVNNTYRALQRPESLRTSSYKEIFLGDYHVISATYTRPENT